MNNKILRSACILLGILLVLGYMVTPTVPVQAEEVITFICSAGGSGKAFSGGIKLFNEKFKGKYRVDVTMVAYEAVQEKEMFQFISGKPSFDVVSYATEWGPGALSYLEPLDSYIQKSGLDVVERFGPGVQEILKYKGQIVRFPTRIGNVILFYRKDLFEQAGLTPPKSLMGIITAARKLTRRTADGEIQVYGTALKAQSPHWTGESFFGYFMPLGGYCLTEDLEHASPSLKGNVCFNVLNMMKILFDEQLVPNPMAWTYDDNIVAFKMGKLAFSTEYSARAMILEDPAASKVAGKMGYTVPPTGQLGPHPPMYVQSGWTFAIDKNSEHKDLAYQFIEFMTSPELQKYMALEFANGPTILSLYDDPEYRKRNPAAVAVQKAIMAGGRDPVPVAVATELEMALHEEVQTFLLGKQTAEKAGSNIYDRVEKILTEK